jgi:hypothetical protein
LKYLNRGLVSDIFRVSEIISVVFFLFFKISANRNSRAKKKPLPLTGRGLIFGKSLNFYSILCPETVMALTETLPSFTPMIRRYSGKSEAPTRVYLSV